MIISQITHTQLLPCDMTILLIYLLFCPAAFGSHVRRSDLGFATNRDGEVPHSMSPTAPMAGIAPDRGAEFDTGKAAILGVGGLILGLVLGCILRQCCEPCRRQMYEEERQELYRGRMIRRQGVLLPVPEMRDCSRETSPSPVRGST